MSTIELQNVSDEQLAGEYLELCRNGKRGSRAFQYIEAEMRARNLLPSEARLSTSYVGERSSRFDVRSTMFSGFSLYR